jgi:hypothetical protein
VLALADPFAGQLREAIKSGALIGGLLPLLSPSPHGTRQENKSQRQSEVRFHALSPFWNVKEYVSDMQVSLNDVDYASSMFNHG